MNHLTPLDVALQQLRLPVFAQLYARLAQEAQTNPLSYEGYLLALAEQELVYRHRQHQYLKLARFPVLKELVDFDFRLVRLAEWLDEKPRAKTRYSAFERLYSQAA